MLNTDDNAVGARAGGTSGVSVRHFSSPTSLVLIGVLALAGCASNGMDHREAENPLSPEERANLEIGLKYDDTIFTTSARTRDFNGQALIPRFAYFESSKGDRKLTVHSTNLRTVIGFHEDVTVALNIPFVSKELRTGADGGRTRVRSKGLGDVSAIGKWRFFKRPKLGGTTEIAGLFGVELPRGRDDVRDGGMRLAQPLQPGSGSVDTILGAAFTRLWGGGQWLINADVFYKANSDANDYRFGNVPRFDVGGQYRVYPQRYERYDQFTLNLIAELNGRHAGKDTLDGDRIDSTGGVKLFASPGIQAIVSENLLFESGIQIPIYHDLNGSQLGEDFLVTVGLRLLF